jgi:hypothetical protein
MDKMEADAEGTGQCWSRSEKCAASAVPLASANGDGAGMTAFRDPGATATVYNTIVHGNGTDSTPPDVTAGSNLVGVGPLFTGPLYRPGAPAIDAGSPAPPGGLGPSDLFSGPRTIDAAPDIGAIEVPEACGGGAGAEDTRAQRWIDTSRQARSP